MVFIPGKGNVPVEKNDDEDDELEFFINPDNLTPHQKSEIAFRTLKSVLSDLSDHTDLYSEDVQTATFNYIDFVCDKFNNGEIKTAQDVTFLFPNQVFFEFIIYNHSQRNIVELGEGASIEEIMSKGLESLELAKNTAVIMKQGKDEEFKIEKLIDCSTEYLLNQTKLYMLDAQQLTSLYRSIIVQILIDRKVMTDD